jgi:DNA polymerase III sliding clamp (beta) subunit (PCNA family)
MLRALSKMHTIFPTGTLVTLSLEKDQLHLVAIDTKYLFRAQIPISTHFTHNNTPTPTSVSLQLLHDLLKTGLGMWSFAQSDGQLRLEFGKGKYQIPILKSPSIPQHSNAGVTWRLPGKELVRLFKDATIAAGDQVQRGVYLHADHCNGCIAAVATDGLRISCARYPYALTTTNHGTALNYNNTTHLSRTNDQTTIGAIISKDLCNALVRWFEQSDVSIGISSAHNPVDLWWEGDGASYHLHASTMQYRFPDYHSVISTDGPRIAVDGPALSTALTRVTLFSQDKTRRVLLQPGDGLLIVKTASIDVGSAIESIPAECSPDAHPWYVDSKNLTDILGKGRVVLYGKPGGVVRAHIRDDWIYVFMSIKDA